jgi:hypothetical protein
MRAHGGGLALRWRNIDCAAVASLPGSGGRASKPARATPIETAAGFYRYTRSPGVRSIVRCESCARGEGRGLALAGRRIKDAVQELIKAHQDAVRVY